MSELPRAQKYIGRLGDLASTFLSDPQKFEQDYRGRLFLIGPRIASQDANAPVSMGFGLDSVLVQIVDELSDWTFRIGQANTNDLLIDAPGAIAPMHAEILKRQGVLYIVDHGSEQGTFVGRLGLERIAPNESFPLEPNNSIRFGPAIPGNSPYLFYGPDLFTSYIAKLCARQEKEEEQKKLDGNAPSP